MMLQSASAAEKALIDEWEKKLQLKTEELENEKAQLNSRVEELTHMLVDMFFFYLFLFCFKAVHKPRGFVLKILTISAKSL